MASAAEMTVSATEFKAKCLDLMNKVHAGELRRLRVTKRGKPLVVIQSDDAGALMVEPWTFESTIGCMKGWPRPVPADHDWEKPLYSDAELDGFLQDTADQIEGNRQRSAA